MAIELKVDGRTSRVDVPGDMPLLWVLRDDVGLVVTGFGCGLAPCGAGTVARPPLEERLPLGVSLADA